LSKKCLFLAIGGSLLVTEQPVRTTCWRTEFDCSYRKWTLCL